MGPAGDGGGGLLPTIRMAPQAPDMKFGALSRGHPTMRGASGAAVRQAFLLPSCYLPATCLLPKCYPPPTPHLPLTYIIYGGNLHGIYAKAAATALFRVAIADSSVRMYLFITFLRSIGWG